MTIQTYKIEIRVDFHDPEKDGIIQELVVETSRQLLSTAAIIADGAKPVIKVQKVPFFGRGEDIPIVETDDVPVDN